MSGGRATAVPNQFFTSFLPRIESPAELLVCCYVFFAFGRQRGRLPSVSAEALLHERPLAEALRRLGLNSETAVQEGLETATRHGLLLKTGVEGGTQIYLLNTDVARREADRVGPVSGTPSEDDAEVPANGRPNIYALYEQNIGALTPLLIDDLEEAERSYPAAWIEGAFREAVANNRRSWRYIARILERWSIEGPNHETPRGRSSLNPPGRRRVVGGPYRRVVERRD